MFQYYYEDNFDFADLPETVSGTTAIAYTFHENNSSVHLALSLHPLDLAHGNTLINIY